MDINNRYVQLGALSLGLAVLIYLVLWLLFSLLQIDGFPVGLQIAIAILGAGLLVYKFFSDRIF
jgi:hypothetical protein